MSAGIPGTKYQGCNNKSEKSIKKLHYFNSKLQNVKVHFTRVAVQNGGRVVK